ncbi:MAG TPA: hypothetical protein VII63_12700 [Caulobacteraceae bacterium]
MTAEAVRIAMWSGPRNISTAMMRAFGGRADCAVIDEPFYGPYLAATGIDHPLREAVLAARPGTWRQVVRQLEGPVPGGRPILYAKHMSHHMLGEIGLGWMDRWRNAFLIRAPEEVLASYGARRAVVTESDIGFVRQGELFDREADRLGRAPPVIDARDVLSDPPRALSALCRALAIPFDPAMLSWPPGPRATDGPWAPAWYDAVERSTGFAPPGAPVRPKELDPTLRPIARAARPHYERLARHKLRW